MSGDFVAITPHLQEYITSRSTPSDPLLRELIQETAALGPISVMQIAELQGTFMGLLVRAISARRIIEVGTFTGYSAICMARALPPDGRILCCDVSDEWTRIARRYFERAGVTGKIDLRIGPALDTLRALPAEPAFDLGFIDADKRNQGSYYEEILLRLRPNGLLLIDNTLRSGRVADSSQSDPAPDPDLDAVRELNDRIPSDPRVEAVLLPIADGLTLVRKRAAAESGSAA
jgi:caffeoyl-CoA O-methyltransferase